MDTGDRRLLIAAMVNTGSPDPYLSGLGQYVRLRLSR
jgi:hypothetical protein